MHKHDDLNSSCQQTVEIDFSQTYRITEQLAMLCYVALEFRVQTGDVAKFGCHYATELLADIV